MDTNVTASRNQHPGEHVQKTRKSGWTLANRLTAISVGIAFASLYLGWQAHKDASRAEQAVEAWRVETGHLNTHSNFNLNADSKGTWGNSWHQWVETISTKTMYVGVQKQINFTKPFPKIPSVTTALSLIQLPRPDIALSPLGYNETDSTAADRLRQVHVLTFVGNITETGFTLSAGVGLPINAGRYLEHELSTTAVSPRVIHELQETNQLDPSATLPLPPDAQWMINFYTLVGTIDASWIAQAPQEK